MSHISGIGLNDRKDRIMKEFPSLQKFQELLEEIIDEIPAEFFNELSGGIILMDQVKFHTESKPKQPLCIMGEYHRTVLGCQIRIYYGSFKHVYNNIEPKDLYGRLKETVIHEFTHHLEYRAGLKDLEIKDKKRIESYRTKH